MGCNHFVAEFLSFMNQEEHRNKIKSNGLLTLELNK